MTQTTVDLLLLAGSVQLIALMSPGPDFALILRNSLMYSKRTALWSSFGIALGVLAHLTYTLMGLTVLITNFPKILTLIGYLGVAYLLWLGISSIRRGLEKNK